MRARVRTALAAAALAAAGVAQACGVCIDDKVAAAYDHAVVTSAMDRGRVMVFAEVSGLGSVADSIRAARRAAARVRGVEPLSVRSAEAPPALSFALDARVRSPAQALDAVERAAAGAGLKLSLLKVLH